MGVTVGRSVASIRWPCDSRTAIESENACQKYRVDDARDSPVNSMQQDDEILSLCHENRIPEKGSRGNRGDFQETRLTLPILPDCYEEGEFFLRRRAATSGGT